MSESAQASDEQSGADRNSRPKRIIEKLFWQLALPITAKFCNINQNDARFHFTPTVFCLALYSLFTYLFDIGSDCYLAAVYGMNRHYWYSSLTATFVLLPLFAISADLNFYGCFRLLDYVDNLEFNNSKCFKMPLKFIVFTLIALPLSLFITLFLPFICYVFVISLGYKQFKWRNNGPMMINADYGQLTPDYAFILVMCCVGGIFIYEVVTYDYDI